MSIGERRTKCGFLILKSVGVPVHEFVDSLYSVLMYLCMNVSANRLCKALFAVMLGFYAQNDRISLFAG